jgi:hypothetical protein
MAKNKKDRKEYEPSDTDLEEIEREVRNGNRRIDNGQRGDDYTDLDARNRSRIRAIDRPVYDDGTLDAGEAQGDDIRQIEDSDLGFVRVDTDTTTLDPYVLDPELAGDSLEIGTDVDAVMDQINDYTQDEDILDDFADRQQAASGSNHLLGRLMEQNGRSPELAADDIDAAWEFADTSGEESVGSSVTTPDHDRVEEIGEALGITYEDDEPLATFDRLRDRDESRWELNPASADTGDTGEEDGEAEEENSAENDELDEDDDLFELDFGR